MMNTRTISFKGEKNTEVHTTGHLKSRLTVVFTICSSGKILKTLIILKGLKKVPKCSIPKNLFVVTSDSGTMNKKIMKDWMTSCLNAHGPFMNTEKTLILLDSFSSHKDDENKILLKRRNYEMSFIPPKTTPF